MLLEVFLEHIFAEIGVKATSEGAAKVWGTLQRLPAWGKRQYIAELRAAIAQMPFIYHDLPLELLGNFVDTDLSLTHRDAITSTIESPETWALPQSPLLRLRAARKFVLLGDAGMGKTTLFRYAALSVTDRHAMSELLTENEATPIPILVPLKAIKIVDELPILSYIQNTFTYFKGSIGLSRLTRLARRGRLLLLLDGYDEIPIAGGIKPFIRELRLLYSRSKGEAETIIRGDPRREAQARFYSAFVGNRIGITSRIEFYFANRFELPLDTVYLRTSGLGDSRVRLVSNIFNRYRQTGGQFFAEKLSEEVFMQGLATAGREGLQRVSTNPLFLTVMCYIYVNAIRQKSDPTNLWRRGELALIDTCVDLLLVDIDEYKARGLPHVEQTALKNRRGLFSEEKKAVLRYIAAHSLLEKRAVLKIEYLLQKAEQFFRSNGGPNAGDILAGLKQQDATSNIVFQIVYCGVVVLTEVGPSGPTFDFPHRRFREVLAADYFNTEDGALVLAQKVDDPTFYEFFLLYAERFPARIGPLVSAVRARIAQTTNTFPLGKLLSSLIQHLPTPAERSQVVENLIEELAGKARGRVLPRSLIQFLQPTARVIGRLEELVSAAQSKADTSMLSLAGQPLRELRDPTYDKAKTLRESTRQPHAIVNTLTSSSSEQRILEFLGEQFPARDIEAVSPGWASELHHLLQTSTDSAMLRSLIANYFGLDKKGGDAGVHRITEVDERLAKIAATSGGFRLAESDFEWRDS